jgi:hypothetical protein
MRTTRSKLEKFGSLALGAVCIFLVFKVVTEIGGKPVEAAHGQKSAAQHSPPRSPKPLRKEINQLASDDPNLNVQTLKEYMTEPLPENPRDPFDFAAPPLSPTRRGAHGVGGAGGIGGQAATPPPQVPFQALGYSERAGVGGEAYLADTNQVYVVHQGDTIAKRYKILKITPLMVEVQDESSGQRVQLPIPEAP